ncbi:ATP-binding protein [Geotalea uraniireducens]|uniref:Putative transcriptional regulator n=2 Tax=Geotalea uraniireducens TaxID=351604 RepID=A5G9H5_GEOUR|nr:ATP-binding protein [Geotalea uraniireducens]ABQ28443.1 putative transcriptional regulator [Geotalea uraniireducens Rf4]
MGRIKNEYEILKGARDMLLPKLMSGALDVSTQGGRNMSQEGQLLDKKSLRTVTGNTANWKELAKDCIAFANAQGGRLLIGIENNDDVPPVEQRIDPGLPDLIRRKLGERTVNVTVLPEIRQTDNGSEYIDLQIPRSMAVASTPDGHYFLRVADESKPVVGDEVMRLAAERSALPWETQTTLHVSRGETDPQKLATFVAGIRASDRVKESVKEKSEDELLDHYLLAYGKWLTNLGILCVGRHQDRARLGTAPVIQFIKYDEQRKKVNKIAWDDFNLTPMELIEAVWREVPDFRERYELPDGLFRQHVPLYDEIVVRELLVNALAHRPYTQRGDIFLNLHPDRLEVVNPGLLPLGVTPQNLLHTTVRRNEHLARIFHDLKLMEREGSGYDKMYEVLLSQGKPVPEPKEGPDRFEVTVRRRILKPQIIDFMAKADQTFQLTQRERIALGLLAQHEALTARELAKALELSSVDVLSPWINRLLSWGLVLSSGRTQATRYFVDPDVLRRLEFPASTTLQRIEPHRLQALIVEDLSRYPRSAGGEINRRIGAEIPYKQVKRAIDALIAARQVLFEGDKRGRRYWLAK